MTILLVIILVITTVFIYLAIPGGRLYRQYENDVQLSLNELVRPQQNLLFTDETIEDLPIPVQKYLSHCGYMGTPLMEHMYLECLDVVFTISQGQNPIKIRYEQNNFVARPDRHAFVDARIFGIPLHGKDTITNGEGSMTIILAKLFSLGQSTGREMSQSQLVTALADAVFMPSLFLQDYVTWRSIDETHAECTIMWGGLTASGIFTFNELGEIIRFDTNDRFYDDNKVSINLPWTAELGSYEMIDGFLRPGSIEIYWHMPDGSLYSYFECDNYSVRFLH